MGVEVESGGERFTVDAGEVILSSGAIGSPPALINAITDAIGNNNLNMPATPQRVWAAINAA